jgi:hypothetical protein
VLEIGHSSDTAEGASDAVPAYGIDVDVDGAG